MSTFQREDRYLVFKNKDLRMLSGDTLRKLQEVHAVINVIRAERGGQIWHVVRPGTQPVRAHESEAHALAMPADLTILNNGTLADLQGTVQRALEWADSQEAQAGQDDTEESGADPLLCSCAGDGYTVQELETGKCQGCGKAVVV